MKRNLPRLRHSKIGGWDKVWLERHVLFTWLSILITLFASVLLFSDVNSTLEQRVRLGRTALIFEQLAFIGIVYFLIYGNLVYHAARLGYLKRRLAHHPIARGNT